MTLNHLNLTVADPTETSAFLAKYFGLQPRGGNLGIQMLNDDRGMVLTLIKARPEDRVERSARPSGFAGGALRAEGAADTPAAGEVKYPSSFHIGFIQPSHERVTRSTGGSETTGSRWIRRRTCTARGRSTSRRRAASPSRS